jgi:hypothetical protein
VHHLQAVGSGGHLCSVDDRRAGFGGNSMNDRRYLIPVAGRLVIDPMTHVKLADAGEWKNYDHHWARKVLHGDVVEGSAPEELKTETANEAPADEPKRTNHKRVRE